MNDHTVQDQTVKGRANDLTEEAKRETQSLRAEVEGIAKSITEDVKSTASETKDYVTAQLKDVRGTLTDQAKESVKRSRSEVASQIGGIASAFHRAGERLQEEDQANLASYTHRIGEQVQGVADYLEDRGLRDIAHDIERFARRQPAAFVGISLAAGLVAARFLKSSRPSEVR